jgi:hypothetical protein
MGQQGDETIKQTPKRILELLFKSVDGLRDKFRVNQRGSVWICTESNLWELADKTTILIALVDITNDQELDEELMEWLESRTKLTQLAKAIILIQDIRDRDFETRLNSNRSLLVIGADVVDFSTGKPILRPLKPNDYVESHPRIVKWKFDSVGAQLHRNDVLNYLKTVFPLQDELDVYLKFMATSLNAFPCKAFGLGVDDLSRSGDNGKSSLIELNSLTLKALEKQNGWLVCSKQEVQSMDGHRPPPTTMTC